MIFSVFSLDRSNLSSILINAAGDLLQLTIRREARDPLLTVATSFVPANRIVVHHKLVSAAC